MERNHPHILTPIKGPPTNATMVVDALIATALTRKASDIHLGVNYSSAVPEPFLLRLRINGKLQMMNGAFMATLHREVVARFKVMAGLNTTEIGIPQDGQIHVTSPAGPVVLRVSTIPGLEGEEMVIRILETKTEEHSLTNLGMTPPVLEQIQKLILQKSGLMVLNGPAGVGKTSTIYAILRTLASPDRKVLTAEDPIESRLPFVSHIQVSPKTNFNSLARSFMRQDADIIFIGEIRDHESAAATVQLAQTGHLVLTTLHTRDAVGVISRLEAFDIHSNFIANTLIGSLAQRLVPKLCPHCRIPVSLDEGTLTTLNAVSPIPSNANFFNAGPGCEECIKGYAGRAAVFELFVVTPEIADIVNRGGSRTEVFQAARGMGMITLLEDMLDAVYVGLTDLNSIRPYLITPTYTFTGETEN
jgi:general secretion pathway protein E